MAVAFRLPGTRAAGCLLIHGFTATPDEVLPLGQALSAAGYAAVGVQLAGHGTSVADLSRQRWQDWAASVSAARAEMDHERVFVIGLSLGALLGLHLAATAPQRSIAGLVCCSTPLRLQDRRLTALRGAYQIPGLRRLGLTIPKGMRGISDPALRAQSQSYDAIPLTGLVELLKLQDVITPLLPHITAPTLILHARKDRTAPVANAAWLAQALTAAPVETMILEHSWHVITEDIERDEVARAVIAFCARVG